MMFCLEKFGQERNSFPPRGRSLITISALMASGILDSSLLYHIKRAKMNGVTAEALTQLAFLQDGLKLGQRCVWQKKFMSRNKEEFGWNMLL